MNPLDRTGPAFDPAALPFSPACKRNKEPILERLRPALAGVRLVLEIGSGTGQHAVHFARHLPALEWQPTDRAECLPGLRARLALEATANVRAPLELDVLASPWPEVPADAVYTANTLHIIPWAAVLELLRGAAALLPGGGTLCVYGPFRYGGAHTSEGNAEFDARLRADDPASGIRDVEAVTAAAAGAGLELVADHAMPANNRLLVWRRR